MDEESEEGKSESALPSEPEIGAIEKASAFVGELVNIQHDLDKQPKRNEAESTQLGEQDPRGGVVVDSEVVPMPSAQTLVKASLVTDCFSHRLQNCYFNL